MSYLYAVEMQIPDYHFNPIKIGFSKNPEIRFTQFTCGPFPFVFLGKWPARRGQDDESLFHCLFLRYRLVGEWFYPAEELVNFIKNKVKTEPRLLTDERRLKRFQENYEALETVEPATTIPLYQLLNGSAESLV